MNVRTKFLAVAMLALGCAEVGSVEAGIVIDKTTGRPIPNEIVVARWEGSVGVMVESRSICYKFEVARADDQGRFFISPVSGNVNPLVTGRMQEIEALAHGYKMSPAYDGSSSEILMEPMTGTPSEQFKALTRSSAMGCDGDKKALLPYLKALHQYKAELATTRQEKLEASSLLYQIELLELGKQEAWRRDEKRRQDMWSTK
jgi:hypothetical protein